MTGVRGFEMPTGARWTRRAVRRHPLITQRVHIYTDCGWLMLVKGIKPP